MISDEKISRYENWNRRSRAYLERVRKEAPDAASEWRLLEMLDSTIAPYRPTYELPPEGLSEFYRSLQDAKLGRLGIPTLIDIGIDGFLHKAEALKLYEMAYHGTGDVLELGTHKGLSTSIIARALQDRGSGRLETIDIDEATNPIARQTLAELPCGERVNFILADAAVGMDELTRKGAQFDFIFVDHWHGYGATFLAAKRMPSLLSVGGYVMFHDFFDPANADPEHVYGVNQAVVDAFGSDKRFMFAGAMGSSALFVRSA